MLVYFCFIFSWCKNSLLLSISENLGSFYRTFWKSYKIGFHRWIRRYKNWKLQWYLGSILELKSKIIEITQLHFQKLLSHRVYYMKIMFWIRCHNLVKNWQLYAFPWMGVFSRTNHMVMTSSLKILAYFQHADIYLLNSENQL